MSEDSTFEAEQLDVPPINWRSRRRWGLAWALGLLFGIGTAVAVLLLSPPEYVAISTIQIKAKPPTLYFDVAVGDDDFETFKRSQMFSAISRVVVDAALNEPVQNEFLKKQGHRVVSDLPLIKAQPSLREIDWLLSKLEAKGIQEEFFAIRMSHSESPQELAEIVNAVTRVYMRDVANEDKQALKKRISNLLAIIDEQDQRVKDLRQQSKTIAKRMGVTSPDAISFKDKVKEAELAALRKEYIDASVELNSLKIHYRASGGTDADLAAQIGKVERLLREMDKELEVREDDGRQFPQDTWELDDQVRQTERRVAEVDEIKDRVRRLKIELEAPDRIKEYEKAQVPQLKDMSTLYKKSALAGLGAFLLVFALIVFLAPRRSRRGRSES